jgi:hypothetical protein
MILPTVSAWMVADRRYMQGELELLVSVVESLRIRMLSNLSKH